ITINDDSSEETIESPIISNQPIVDNEQHDTEDIPVIESIEMKRKMPKRSNRHEQKSSSEPELVVITSSPLQTKR
ncbi:unnamed protein product, partial [Rotaria magnacalcarata]